MSKRILVVDDDPTSLKLTASSLTSLKYDVKTINQAGDIEQVTKNFKPDCIIMDLLMPQVDGQQAVRRLQKDPALSRIPVIFLTAVNMRNDESGAEFEINVQDTRYRTLIKPVDAKTLNNEITALLKA